MSVEHAEAVEVLVSEVMKSVDPLAERLIEDARKAGCDTSRMKLTWVFTAVVERNGGAKERWLITREQADQILAEFRRADAEFNQRVFATGEEALKARAERPGIRFALEAPAEPLSV